MGADVTDGWADKFTHAADLSAADAIDQGEGTIADRAAALAADAASANGTALRRAAEVLAGGHVLEATRYLLQAHRYAGRVQGLRQFAGCLEVRRRRSVAQAVAQGVDNVEVDERALALRVYFDQSTTLLRSALSSDATPPSDLARAKNQGYADALVQVALLIRNTGGGQS